MSDEDGPFCKIIPLFSEQLDTGQPPAWLPEAGAPYQPDKGEVCGVEERNGGGHNIGLVDEDGILQRIPNLRSVRASRPLDLNDRFIVWHLEFDGADNGYTVMRLGDMTLDNLLCAAKFFQHKWGKQGLIGPALQWLWWRLNAHSMASIPCDDTTLAEMTDSEGHSVLDWKWETALV